LSLSHWIVTLRLRLRSLFRREQVEQELSEELLYHLEKKIQEHLAAGLTKEEARRKALREFGGVELSKEHCRDSRRVSYIQDLLQDLGFGLRILRNSPAFAIVAILTLALGIGANTAIFSVIHGVLLRPLPFPKQDQLMILFEKNNDGTRSNTSWATFMDSIEPLLHRRSRRQLLVPDLCRRARRGNSHRLPRLLDPLRSYGRKT